LSTDAATAVATVFLPASLVTLFPGAPRRLEVEAATVAGLVDVLNARWPGMRDRLCAPGPSIRQHISVFVDGERSTLTTALHPASVVHVIPAVSGG
jgi:molybdopterin synthase sulfur carrier subunit